MKEVNILKFQNDDILRCERERGREGLDKVLSGTIVNGDVAALNLDLLEIYFNNINRTGMIHDFFICKYLPYKV